MPSVKLTYFDGRGLGEPARLILHHAGIPFEDVRLTQQTWPDFKPKTKTGKLPMLEFDGHTLVESYAIHRFLARKYGLAGKDEFEQAEVDGWADVQKDFNNAVAPWIYTKMGYRPGNADELRKEHLEESVKRFFPIFEQTLKNSGSGFLVKSGLTWADFAVSEFLITLHIHAPEVFNGHSALLDYVKRVKDVPKLKQYYATRKE